MGQALYICLVILVIVVILILLGIV